LELHFLTPTAGHSPAIDYSTALRAKARRGSCATPYPQHHR